MPNNQTKPNQTQTTPLGAGGIDRGRVDVKAPAGSARFPAGQKSEAERRSSAMFARAAEFADRLPGEEQVFVASAFLSERHRLRRDPSVDEVMARLRATGRDAGSRNV